MGFFFLVFLLLPFCSPSLHIVTDGSAKRLPQKNAHVAVWGLRHPHPTDSLSFSKLLT